MAVNVTVENLSGNQLSITGVNRPSGLIAPNARGVSLTLTEAEWDLAKPALDAMVADGLASYVSHVNGMNSIRKTITNGDLTEAALTQDITIGTLPIGAVPVGGGSRLIATFTGGTLAAMTAQMRMGSSNIQGSSHNVFGGALASLNMVDEKLGPLGAATDVVVRFLATADNVDGAGVGELYTEVVYWVP